MEKNSKILIIAIAAILVAFILRDAVIKRNQTENIITVTGMGSENFTSDLIVWSGNFNKHNYDLKEAYANLDKDREKLKKYLISQGVPTESIVFSAINISQDYTYEYDAQGRSRSIFNGYNLSQSVQIESKEVDKIEDISRKSGELINQGIEFYSNAPEYYYTKLSELKIKMIAAATEDGKERAKQIAKNANASLGKLKKANLGVFQIIAQNSSEEYSWGGSFNTYSKNKTATVTTRLEFQVK